MLLSDVPGVFIFQNTIALLELRKLSHNQSLTCLGNGLFLTHSDVTHDLTYTYREIFLEILAESRVVFDLFHDHVIERFREELIDHFFRTVNPLLGY